MKLALANVLKVEPESPEEYERRLQERLPKHFVVVTEEGAVIRVAEATRKDEDERWNYASTELRRIKFVDIGFYVEEGAGEMILPFEVDGE